ncbi:MAG: hypothetical protein NT049_08995, partial [Planctomycetota bacterium]|nr:hypothetical protein [Planctomycetota bacterium]
MAAVLAGAGVCHAADQPIPGNLTITPSSTQPPPAGPGSLTITPPTKALPTGPGSLTITPPATPPPVMPPPAKTPPATTPPASGQTSSPASVPWKTGGEEPSKSEGMSFRLPGACLNPDGTMNHDAIVEAQKKRLEPINKEMSLQMRLVETPHFLIFSEADGPTTDNYKKWCELLYNSLCNQFLIIHKERVWDGKCILFLLQRESTFKDFSKRIDGRDAPEDRYSKA